MAKIDETQNKKKETVALKSNTSQIGLRNPAQTDESNDDGGFGNQENHQPQTTRINLSEQQTVRIRNTGGSANNRSENNAIINQEPEQDEEESKKLL